MPCFLLASGVGNEGGQSKAIGDLPGKVPGQEPIEGWYLLMQMGRMGLQPQEDWQGVPRASFR